MSTCAAAIGRSARSGRTSAGAVQLLLDRGADRQGQPAEHWLALAKKNRAWRDRVANMGPNDDLDQVLAAE